MGAVTVPQGAVPRTELNEIKHLEPWGHTAGARRGSGTRVGSTHVKNNWALIVALHLYGLFLFSFLLQNYLFSASCI